MNSHSGSTWSGAVTMMWADDTYTFRLAFGQIVELEEKRGAPIAEIADRLATRRWYAADITETIRLGLIGGGVKPEAALRLVERYVKARPLMESVPVAIEIIGAAILLPDDLVETLEGNGEAAARADADGSPPAAS